MAGSLEEATLNQILAEEEARKASMAKQWDAYNGRFPKPLRPAPGQPDDNVRVNRIRPIIDASVSLLFGNPPSYELPKSTDGEDSSKRSEPEQYLDDLFNANSWPAKLLDLGINGGVTGTAYLHIVPDDPFPRIQIMDPTCMSIRWDPRDIDKVQAYIWQYNTLDEKNRPIVVRQLCERQGEIWLITDQHADITAARFNAWINDGDPVVWPHSWPPYLHCKNLPAPNQVYGLADYGEIIIELNKAKNFNLSNRRKIDRFHSHPKTWVRGVEGVSIDIRPDGITKIEGDGAEIGQLVPAIASEAAATLGREIDQAIEQESMTPALLLGRDDGEGVPASGAALRIRLIPANTKLDMKRKLYGPMLVELCRRLLDLKSYGPDKIVRLTWPEPLQVDLMAERQTLLIDQQLGVASKATIAEKLGYDWETERDNLEQEEADLGEKVLNDFTNGPGGQPVDRPNGVEGI